MNGHPMERLDAYLDGELNAARAQAVERHLADCARCREALAERRRLSEWLRADPPAPLVRSDRRFAAEVALRLPRGAHRGARPVNWRRILDAAVPAALLAAWAFARTVDVVGGAVEWVPGLREWLAPRLALLPHWDLPAPARLWGAFAAQNSLAGWTVYTGWLLWAGLSLLFVAWLAGWCLAHSMPKPEENR